MRSEPSTPVIIYGLPGVGKSSVASVLAAVQGSQHIEMSACAQMIYNESDSQCATFHDFVREELWARSDFARVARRASRAWSGGSVVVSGPRRQEELDELMQSLDTDCVLRLVADERTRIQRATVSGQVPEAVAARAIEESAWGLVGRRTRGSVDVDNSLTLSAAVWASIHAVVGIPFPSSTDDCSDNLEREARYQNVSSVDLAQRLAQVGDVARETIVDDWYIPSRIGTRSQHDAWLASGLCGPVRVRRGSVDLRVTIKSPPTVHGVAQELTVRVGDAFEKHYREVVSRFGLRRAVQLKKLRHRTSLPSEGITLCYDEYEDGTGCLEVEFQQTAMSPHRSNLLTDRSGWSRHFQGVDLRPTRPVPLRAVESSLDHA
jgi:dephospho-CoA kinase